MADIQTCWTIVRGAADGDDAARGEFARRYEPVVRGYFNARWSSNGFRSEIDDAVQEVFVDAFREGGALQRLDSSRAGGFRPFLYGVVRNVALRAETKRARLKEVHPASTFEPAADDATLSQLFDRTWALGVMEQALRLQADRAVDEPSRRRLEILRLRFQDDLPIRTIAERWDEEPAAVHKWYARAREEFRRCLVEVVSFHQPDSSSAVEAECSQLFEFFQ